MSSTKDVRVWKVNRSSTAGVEITDNTAVVAGNRTNFMAATGAGLVFVGNSLSFGTLSENQRHAGLFIKMNDLVQMVPTTLATPMPNQIPFPPFGAVKSILTDLPFFLGMIGASATQAL